MKKDKQRNPEDLARQLARIFHMDREDLLRWWDKLYDTKPPLRMSSKLMMRALAYKVQEQALGGLRPATRRLLVLAAQEVEVSRAAGIVVSPGTRLIREWHGHTYEVTILEKGVLFQGKQYASLTKVARMITGTHWSGPDFFGLHGKKGVIRS